MSAPLDPRALRDRLARFPPVLQATAAVVTPTDLRWKPAPEHWSILEVCCHLLDEEREDFRVRAELTLRDPLLEWPQLELAKIAEVRNYQGRDPEQVLAAFTAERAANVAWLDSLGGADWSRAKVHPRLGPLSAGTMLAAWAAHDALHLRQVARRLHELAARDAGACSVRYAGEW